MALSFCSDWDSVRPVKPPEMRSFQHAQPELPGDFMDIHATLGLEQCSFDHLLDPSNDLFGADNFTNFMAFFDLPPDNLVPVSPDIFPAGDFNSLDLPKRQKTTCDNFYTSFHDTSPVFPSGYVSTPGTVVEPFDEFVSPVPGSEIPEGFSYGPAEIVQKASGVGLSAQSIAARQRRRKIAEKLQELGKLVPGGPKMNTAAMLQSAFKYVKFLQTQIGILELMKASQEAKESTETPELQCLLASTIIQEKLYLRDKCLIPQELVQNLASDPEIQRKPSVAKEIDHLMRAHS